MHLEFSKVKELIVQYLAKDVRIDKQDLFLAELPQFQRNNRAGSMRLIFLPIIVSKVDLGAFPFIEESLDEKLCLAEFCVAIAFIEELKSGSQSSHLCIDVNHNFSSYL